MLPPFAHIVTIVMENQNASRVIGNADAPAITRFAAEYGNATQMHGVVHPSEGNYIAMIAGSPLGVHDDAMHALAGRTLVDQLEAAKRSWRGYFESIPSPGFLGAYAGGGLYAAKHNPFVQFTALRESPAFAEHTVGFDALQADIAADRLPAFAFVVPNQCDDMHGIRGMGETCETGSAALVRHGDGVVASLVDALMRTRAWNGRENMAIVVTFDEDEGAGTVPAVVLTNHGPRRVSDATPYDHTSLLRTVEDAFGISEHLGAAASATPMTKLFAK